MNTIVLAVGRVTGIAGALLCVVAVVLRISGRYTAGGFQVGTLLIAGIALISGACFCLLLILVNRANR